MVPRTILRQLARLRGKERRLRFTWGVARWLALSLIVLAVACFTDWFIDRRQETPWELRRGMLLMQVLLSSVAFLYWVLGPLFRRMSNSQAALWIEEKIPELKQCLISAVQLNRRGALTEGMSSALIASVTREAEEVVGRINVRQIPDSRRLAWSAVLALPPLAIAGLLYLGWPDTIRALLARQLLTDTDIPRSIQLESVTPEVWPSGEEVLLNFRAIGDGVAGSLQGEVELEPDDRPPERYPLAKDRLMNSFEASLDARVPPSSSDFSYRAWANDGRTKKTYRVHFVPRPAIVEQHAWLVLPRYWGLRPDGSRYEQYQPRGDIVGLPHTSARVSLTTQKPIKEAVLELLGPPQASALRRVDEGAAEMVLRQFKLKLEADGLRATGTFDLREAETAYRLVVKDEHNFTNSDPPRRNVRILPEEAPHVVLLREQFPAAAGSLTEDAEVEGIPVPLGGPIRIAYACAAPQGLGRAQLRYRVNDGKWQTHVLSEVPASEKAGAFDVRQGVFATSGLRDQVEFHAVPSADPRLSPGRTEGGGRLDFQTRAIPDLKVGDRIEYFVEVFDRNPDSVQAGRSETRQKTIVTTQELLAWIDQTLHQEERIRKLEDRQRGVFGGAAGEP
jgi:hypothetical protein